MTLIIGNGEMGSALANVLSEVYEPVFVKDVEDLKLDKVKWMHVCYPYNKDFVKITQDYINKYKPTYTIIHSTVVVGTTRKIGENVWHSPMRGLHPDLESGIKTFTKYIGGKFNSEVNNYFADAGIKFVHVDDPETTELGKLLDTTYYGWIIAFCKEAEKICKEYKADFSVAYTHMNQSYNEGYTKLSKPHFVRPLLVPMRGPIGGHCVIPNCHLFKSKISEILLKLNKGWKQ